MYTIKYEVKVTRSNNTYYKLDTTDRDWLIIKLIQIQSYMNELSITKDNELKEFVKWFESPSKTLPISTKFKRHNSPQSYVAGTLNNLLYNNQSDITDTQANHLEYIINSYVQVSTLISLELQKNRENEQIEFRENLWKD